MTATDTWTALEDSRDRARRSAAVHVGVPLVLGVVAGLWAVLVHSPDTSASFLGGLLMALFWTYAALAGRVARRRFERHHQIHILPKILEDAGAHLACTPDSTPSWVALHRSRLFAPAQQARPGPLLYGTVDGVFLEAGAVVLTTEKVIRKVRRVQKPVFSGAVYTADLGPSNMAGDLVMLGRGARWPRAARRMAQWRRFRIKGLPWGVRMYARVGTDPVVGADLVPFFADIARLGRKVSLSIQDQRHLVVVLPGRASLFRPASVFAPLARDARAARSLSIMRTVGALARALGAPEAIEAARPVLVGDEEAAAASGMSPKNALVRAWQARQGQGGAATQALEDGGRAPSVWTRARTGMERARAHPVTRQAGLVWGEVVRAFKGSAPVASASERTMEAWDDWRVRLGVAPPADAAPRIVPVPPRPQSLAEEGEAPKVEAQPSSPAT